MRITKKKKHQLMYLVVNHVSDNLKEYMIVSILLLIRHYTRSDFGKPNGRGTKQ